MATQSLSQTALTTKQLVAKKNTRVADVVRAVRDVMEGARRRAQGGLAPIAERLPAPKPGSLQLTDDDQVVVRAFVNAVANLPELPAGPAELSTEQEQAVTRANLAVKGVAGVVKRFDEAFRILTLNHNTAAGERSGEVTEETPRDGKGWALLPHKYSVPGETATISVEVRSGAVTLDEAALKGIADREEALGEADPSYTPRFTHKDYLGCTSQIRVTDEDKVLRLLASNPEIAEVIGEAATVQNPTVSVNKR